MHRTRPHRAELLEPPFAAHGPQAHGWRRGVAGAGVIVAEPRCDGRLHAQDLDEVVGVVEADLEPRALLTRRLVEGSNAKPGVLGRVALHDRQRNPPERLLDVEVIGVQGDKQLCGRFAQRQLRKLLVLAIEEVEPPDRAADRDLEPIPDTAAQRRLRREARRLRGVAEHGDVGVAPRDLADLSACQSGGETGTGTNHVRKRGM